MAEDKLTFAAIVLVAIVAIVGLIGFMGPGIMSTGLASASGTVSINLAGTANIGLTVNSCDFGSGYVNSSFSMANVDCNGTKTNWINTTAFSPHPMTLTNNGSTLVSVTLKSNDTATTFIGAGATQLFAGVVTTAGSCSGTLTTAYTALTTSDVAICTQMEYASANNVFNITYNIGIPVNATQGAKASLITFTGTAI